MTLYLVRYVPDGGATTDAAFHDEGKALELYTAIKQRGCAWETIDAFGIRDKVSYISTGGGTFLEFMEGKTLPAVAMLEKRARESVA